MKYVVFTQDSILRFQDPETMKIQWYKSDVFYGEKVEICDVVSGCETSICVKLIDGEYGLVNPNHIRLI